jgi:hypothetical protein
MKHLKHWQDPVAAVLGVWLVASPWVLGFQGQVPAKIATVILGVLLIASSIGEMALPEAWEEWLDLGLGLLLLSAPWLSGFSDVVIATQNAVVCGLLVLALALWVLATDGGWLHRHS